MNGEITTMEMSGVTTEESGDTTEDRHKATEQNHRVATEGRDEAPEWRDEAPEDRHENDGNICNIIIKGFFWIIDIFAFIDGVIVFATGIVIIKYEQEEFPSTSLSAVHTLAIVCIVLGLLQWTPHVVSFFTLGDGGCRDTIERCCGTRFEKVMEIIQLTFDICFLIIFILAQIGCARGFIPYQNFTPRVEDVFSYEIQSEAFYDNSTRNYTQSGMGWNKWQVSRKCCGANGPEDYNGIELLTQFPSWIVPPSCCKLTNNTINTETPFEQNAVNFAACTLEAATYLNNSNSLTNSTQLYTRGCLYDEPLTGISTFLNAVTWIMFVVAAVNLISDISKGCHECQQRRRRQ